MQQHLHSAFAMQNHYDSYLGDVTAAQAAAGKDVQGILWENLDFSREDYREADIVHWDAATRLKKQVLDLSGSSSAANDGLLKVQLSTIIAHDELAIAGGFNGEVIARNIRSGKLMHNQRVSYDENAITNAFDIFDKQLMTSSNDSFIRCYDLNSFQMMFSFHLDTAVNHATRQKNGKMICAVGDDHLVQMLDISSNKRIAKLHGHEEFSFATWWHPNDVMFASGSEDKTCRIWD
eukprot:IDg5935t1